MLNLTGRPIGADDESVREAKPGGIGIPVIIREWKLKEIESFC